MVLVALALFTGPNRSAGSTDVASAAPTSTTFLPKMPVLQPIVPAALSAAPNLSLHDRIVKWIKAVPPKRTRAEALAVLKYNAGRRNPKARAAAPKVVIRRGVPRALGSAHR
ncbi:MAG TPA: hypothetical protein VGP92_07300 [Acidimicrobiia bacterium]|nr:hypothetical protein [Acidimicrobiia bacterium]